MIIIKPNTPPRIHDVVLSYAELTDDQVDILERFFPELAMYLKKLYQESVAFDKQNDLK